MTRPHDISRRDFVRGATALAALPLSAAAGPLGPTERAAAPAAAWQGYAGAIVIDFLASPGYFNYPLDPPLDAAMVRNAAQSGITAVNLTVSQGDFESTVAKIARWEANIDAHPDVLARVRTVDQLLRAKRDGRFGIVYGFQDTVPIDRDPGRLEVFGNLGVKVIQLTYNVRNLVGDGCLEPANAGLSRFGREVVERMDGLGILVDLSHCGQRTTAEGIAASSNPVAITHSGCAAVAPHPRSKQDAELRAMAERGGVIGIYLMPFLSPGREPTTADVVAHIEHAVQVCGEDHVGIGSDLSVTPIDGSDEYWRLHREFVAARIARGIAAPAEDPDMLFTVPELNSHRRMELIADALDARGHSSTRIEKILGGNFLRLFREVWRA
ncbi:MAG TPA: membrane dipeptidase [Longimicrobiales bacterium]|nr:membrane dipeptidase [Longimicrobiales bacterium]